LIADFLDRETARIDRLITEKGRLVDSLNEKIAALIEKAIAQEGPETRLGRHVDILSGYAFPSAEFSKDMEDIPLLRGVNVRPGSICWEETVYWPRQRLAEVSRFILSPGDVVLGMDRPWISSGIRVAEVRESDTPSLLLQRVCRITRRRSLDKGFMKLLLSSRRFLGYFEPILTGVSVPHISPGQVGAFPFNYINVDRQRAAADSVGRASSSIKELVQVIEKSLERLHEFRNALITAAVTGQIDVATWGKHGETDRRLERIQDELAEPHDAGQVEARA
jgi:type I restriction enzyme S subunit